MRFIASGHPELRSCRLALVFVFLILSAAILARPAAAQGEIATLLGEIGEMTDQALAAAERGASGATIADVKQSADEVYRLMWGISSGLADPGASGAVATHGWKERWQTDETDFDSVYAIRYSGLPPTITDPRELGIIGRGREARRLLDAVIADSLAPAGRRLHAGHALASLNNVIGWMQMETGRIKNEIQPRVDLTRLWDAPVEFWNSTADTGWGFEVLAQAINILKVDYDDVAEARSHAAAMSGLIRKSIHGVDADGNGQIAPTMMEGGVEVAVDHAKRMGG